MGYYAHVYGIELARFRGVVGSEDARLIVELGKSARQRYDDDSEYFSRAIKEGAPPLEQAVEDIVFGVAEHAPRELGWRYGYALEVLIDHFGRDLTRGDPEMTFIENLEWAWLKLKEYPPIAIPTIADFPGIITIELGEVHELRRRLANEDLNHAQDHVIEMRKAFKRYIDEASAEMLDIVIFIY